MIGCNEQKEYFKRAIEQGKLSHSYLFEGQSGVGKRTFAVELAKKLLCENPTKGEPCNECNSCTTVDCGSHPDLITIEKDGKTIKVETVREKLVKELSIKPFKGNKKIVIIDGADAMGVEAQNAILKSIEEPPSYALIILVCENAAKLLSTIHSRCITIRFNPLHSNDIHSYFSQMNVPAENISLLESLGEGSIGKIKKMLEDETFWEIRKESISYLERLREADLVETLELSKEISKQDDGGEKNTEKVVPQILTFWLLWYRDLMIIKAQPQHSIYYEDHKNEILADVERLNVSQVKSIIELIQLSQSYLNRNVSKQFVLDSLLIKIKKASK